MQSSILRAWGPIFLGFILAAAIAAGLLASAGCGSPRPGAEAGDVVEGQPDQILPSRDTTTGASEARNSNDPGIMPMGGGVAAPVTNPGAVEGGGSAAGAIAKDRARSAAERASQPPPAATDSE